LTLTQPTRGPVKAEFDAPHQHDNCHEPRVRGVMEMYIIKFTSDLGQGLRHARYITRWRGIQREQSIPAIHQQQHHHHNHNRPQRRRNPIIHWASCCLLMSSCDSTVWEGRQVATAGEVGCEMPRVGAECELGPLRFTQSYFTTFVTYSIFLPPGPRAVTHDASSAAHDWRIGQGGRRGDARRRGQPMFYVFLSGFFTHFAFAGTYHSGGPSFFLSRATPPRCPRLHHW
jgi:hypothetical protein